MNMGFASSYVDGQRTRSLVLSPSSSQCKSGGRHICRLRWNHLMAMWPRRDTGPARFAANWIGHTVLKYSTYKTIIICLKRVGGGWYNSRSAGSEGCECYAGPERGQNIFKTFLNKRNNYLLLQKLREISFVRNREGLLQHCGRNDTNVYEHIW
jgi:hypothetical protein